MLNLSRKPAYTPVDGTLLALTTPHFQPLEQIKKKQIECSELAQILQQQK